MSKTISGAIIQWMYTNGTIDIDEDISTDQLEAMATAYGLYKTPQTTITPYADGTRDITAYYRFLARQRAQTERERAESGEWLEAFEAWVRARNVARVLPTLPEGLYCQSVGIVGSASVEAQEGGQAIYQLSFSINYIDGRKTE